MKIVSFVLAMSWILVISTLFFEYSGKRLIIGSRNQVESNGSFQFKTKILGVSVNGASMRGIYSTSAIIPLFILTVLIVIARIVGGAT